LLVNTLASIIPAPTRTIYASSKAASLLLYQALSIEHPRIAFTHLLPGTIEGDFRASAVDGGKAREADPNKTGLKRDAVARRCIAALEHREKNVFMPWTMRPGHLLYWVWPGFVEWRAMAKYNFTPPA
jgi:short-subunit dehydrogenase